MKKITLIIIISILASSLITGCANSFKGFTTTYISKKAESTRNAKGLDSIQDSSIFHLGFNVVSDSTTNYLLYVENNDKKFILSTYNSNSTTIMLYDVTPHVTYQAKYISTEPIDAIKKRFDSFLVADHSTKISIDNKDYALSIDTHIIPSGVLQIVPLSGTGYFYTPNLNLDLLELIATKNKTISTSDFRTILYVPKNTIKVAVNELGVIK